MSIPREEYLQLARALDAKGAEMQYTILCKGHPKQDVTWGDLWAAQADMIQDWVEKKIEEVEDAAAESIRWETKRYSH